MITEEEFKDTQKLVFQKWLWQERPTFKATITFLFLIQLIPSIASAILSIIWNASFEFAVIFGIGAVVIKVIQYFTEKELYKEFEQR